MTLVEIVCRSCPKVLATIESGQHPADWTGTLSVPACPDHGWRTTGPLGSVWRELADSHDEHYPPVVQRTVAVRYAAVRARLASAGRTPARFPV